MTNLIGNNVTKNETKTTNNKNLTTLVNRTYKDRLSIKLIIQ